MLMEHMNMILQLATNTEWIIHAGPYMIKTLYSYKISSLYIYIYIYIYILRYSTSSKTILNGWIFN